MPEVPQQTAKSVTPSPSSVAQPQPTPAYYPPPTDSFANTSLNEKSGGNGVPSYSTPPPPPPPAYPPGPAVLSMASALYAYTPTDAGDLALQPNDRVQVLEHMNNDCMSQALLHIYIYICC